MQAQTKKTSLVETNILINFWNTYFNLVLPLRAKDVTSLSLPSQNLDEIESSSQLLIIIRVSVSIPGKLWAGISVKLLSRITILS